MNQKLMTRLIRRYGTPILHYSGTQVTAYFAIFQPVTSRSWQNMERMIPTVGEIPRGQYLYIGPVSEELKNGDRLRMDNRNYIVRRADRLHFKEEALFVWGLCVEGGIDDDE